MEISGTELLILIAGSAALLLWGARMMRTGMTRAYGAQIRQLLSARAGNRALGLLAGIFSASVLQSSTAVALLTASFASAGVLAVKDGLIIMLGADLGSALVALVLALDIRSIWPVLMFVGYVLHAGFGNNHPLAKQAGRVSMGLALVFLALSLLSSTSNVLKQSDTVNQLLIALANEPLIAILIGAALTWLAHSSIVILLLVAGLATAGVLSHGTLAFALVLGINAGAALPAFVMTLGDKPPARQIALGNLAFRIIAVILAAFTMPLWVPYFSNGSVSGNQVIFAHIAFNLVLALVFTGLTGIAEHWLASMVPEGQELPDEGAPRYLDETAKDVPGVALTLAARETLRMVDFIDAMVNHCLQALRNNDTAETNEAKKLEENVDSLYEPIKFYVSDIESSETTATERRRATEIITFTTHLESAGDVIDRNLIDTIRQKVKAGEPFSKAGSNELAEIFEFISQTIRLASSVFMEPSEENAHALIARKEELRQLELSSTELHLARLRHRKPQAMATSSYHLDIIRDLKRVNSHFVSVAYPILETSGGLRSSRLKKIRP